MADRGGSSTRCIFVMGQYSPDSKNDYQSHCSHPPTPDTTA